MKTSELRKIVEENKYIFENNGYCILIKGSITGLWFLKFVEGNIFVNSEIHIRTKELKKCLVALIEYSLTPLNEREDEKKYRIRIDNAISNIYLSLKVNKNTYFLSVFKDNSKEYQKIFTKQEIDNFPSEIKGAIECGFLRKVEVE